MQIAILFTTLARWHDLQTKVLLALKVGFNMTILVVSCMDEGILLKKRRCFISGIKCHCTIIESHSALFAGFNLPAMLLNLQHQCNIVAVVNICLCKKCEEFGRVAQNASTYYTALCWRLFSSVESTHK